MSNFNKVGTFMKTFGQEVKTKPSLSTDKINKLRIDLIKEELEELTEAMNNKDLLEVADALKTQSINVIAPTSQDNSVTQQNNTLVNEVVLPTFDPLDNY